MDKPFVRERDTWKSRQRSSRRWAVRQWNTVLLQTQTTPPSTNLNSILTIRRELTSNRSPLPPQSNQPPSITCQSLDLLNEHFETKQNFNTLLCNNLNCIRNLADSQEHESMVNSPPSLQKSQFQNENNPAFATSHSPQKPLVEEPFTRIRIPFQSTNYPLSNSYRQYIFRFGRDGIW